MRLSTTSLIPLTAAAFVALSGVAMAKVVNLHATLAPPSTVTSSGQGMMTGHYNTATRMLYWHVTYSHLSGKETMAHFHGPAKTGANGPVLVAIAGKHASPLTGHKKITASQAKVILDGMAYVNVHSTKFPAGEIRGQVQP